MKKIISANMDKRFSKFIWSSIISSILMAIVGFVMLFAPDLSNKILGLIVGILIIIKAIGTIYKFIKRDGTKLYLLNILYGVLLLIIGIVIICIPLLVSRVLMLLLGLFLIVLGSNKITYAIWFKIADNKLWLITFTTGLLIVIFGIIAIVNPFVTMTVTALIGTLILMVSILDISNLIMLKKNAKNIIEMFW